MSSYCMTSPQWVNKQIYECLFLPYILYQCQSNWCTACQLAIWWLMETKPWGYWVIMTMIKTNAKDMRGMQLVIFISSGVVGTKYNVWVSYKLGSPLYLENLHTRISAYIPWYTQAWYWYMRSGVKCYMMFFFAWYMTYIFQHIMT